MALTLRDARAILGRYAGQGNDFTSRINEVIARYLTKGNFKGSKARLRFAVYIDRNGNRIITTPQWVENVESGAYEPICDGGSIPNGNIRTWGGLVLPLRNGNYEFSQSGPGNMWGTDWQTGIIRMEGKYTTFADWNEPMLLRIKPERNESPGGKIIFRGYKDGEKIWSADPDSGQWIEGVALPFTTTAAVTTTQDFDEPPYQVIKPKTFGRLRLYAVDADAAETLVGDYNPQELNPSYARYKVPVEATAT